MKTYKRFDLNFVKGKGVYLFEKNGDKYLDFVAGIAVNALGHSNEKIVKAIKEQSEQLIHISNLYYDDHQINLSKKLIELSDHQSVFFCNSGTEAIEGTVKIARKYGQKMGKSKILYFDNAFHGRTLGALSVTSNEKYKKSFKPLVPNVEQVKLNDQEDFLDKFDESVCAVIIEPIQGEGGINPVDEDFLQLIRDETSTNNALLIFDEVQAGIGRTGTFFAYEGFNVTPDVIALAKGLGGGVPIGAFIANEKADVLSYGDHGCTFGGNPLVTAVSNVVVDEVSNLDFLLQVTEKGNYLKNKLNVLKKEYSIITKIKGKGLMIGVDFEIDPKKIVELALEEKLLIINAGVNTIRLVPALNVSYKEIDAFIYLFEKVIKKAEKL
jgi:acetylornithine/N-succinyldiaminopimelate aminotransferase